MRLIDALREIEKCIVRVASPDWIRMDIHPNGVQISAKNNINYIIIKADFSESFESLNTSIVIPDPEALKIILSAPDYQSSETRAFILPRAGKDSGRIVFYGKNDSMANISVWESENPMAENCKRYQNPVDAAQLVMTVDAIWKQNFEYWAKAYDDTMANFFWRSNKLYCMIGDKRFDYSLWHCDHDGKSDFITAFEFPCKPMLKILSGYALFKRPAISISAAGWLRMYGKTVIADYNFYIDAKVPYWFESATSPVYDIDDPRSVMSQRPDGG